MAKQPDRWERMVKARYFNDRSDARDTIRLLRQQHRAVVRMLKQERDRSRQRVAESPLDSSAHNEASACWSVLEQLLAKLNERAK